MKNLNLALVRLFQFVVFVLFTFIVLVYFCTLILLPLDVVVLVSKLLGSLGIGTLFGAIIGAILVIALENFVSLYTERWLMVLGFMFIFTMIFAPTGVLGAARNFLKSREKK